MSAEPQDLPAEPRFHAPLAIRIAGAALLAMAVLLLAQLVVAVYELVELDSIVGRIAPGVGATANEVDSFKSDESSYTFFFCGVIIFFIGFLALASVYSWLGKRSGQVLGIIYAIPLLFCFAVPFMPGSDTRLETAFDNAEPSWAVVIDYATFALSPLALLVIVLLLSKSARQHFSWLPPAPPGYMWAPSAIPWPYEDRQDR